MTTSAKKTFNCVAPIRITGSNFHALQHLQTRSLSADFQASEIANFITTHATDAYTAVHDDTQPYYFWQKEANDENTLFKADMWETTYQSAKTGQNRTDSFLIIHEVITETNNDRTTLSALHPRLIVTNGQNLFAYKMSCCVNTFSAISLQKQNGNLSPMLIESDKTKNDMRDLFGIHSPNNNAILEDPEGHILSHWRDHVVKKDVPGSCHGHVRLPIPPRRIAFCAH